MDGDDDIFQANINNDVDDNNEQQEIVKLEDDVGFKN
jgi:hypothetical protein